MHRACHFIASVLFLIAISITAFAGQVTVCQCNILASGAGTNSKTGNTIRHDFAVWVSQQTIDPPIAVIGMEELAGTESCDAIVSELESATGVSWLYKYNSMGRWENDSGEAVYWRPDMIDMRGSDWYLGAVTIDHLDNGYYIKFMGQLLALKNTDEVFGVISGKLVWDDAVKNGSAVTEADRQQEAVTLKNWIRNGSSENPGMSIYPDAVRIITTDLNTDTNTDTWNEMNLEYSDPGTEHTAPGSYSDTWLNLLGRRIDYIWWDYDAGTKRSGGFVNSTHRSSDFGSDHRAVYGTIYTHAIDLTAPTVSLAYPQNGASLSGSPIQIAASASDASGIGSVEFTLDDTVVGTDTASPYTYAWTPSGERKYHTMKVTAYDKSPRTYSADSAEAIVWYDPTGLPASIASAKLIAANSTKVFIPDEIVTAVFSSYCYVEEPGRTSGIRVVNLGFTPTVGTRLTINGTIKTDTTSERYIQATSYENKGAAADLVKPLAIKNSAVGGGPFGSYVRGIYNGYGTNNTGLLVTVWGKVTGTIGSTYLYIDDGSGLDDGNAYAGNGVSYKGLRVDILGSISGWTFPTIGSFVRITGISSVANISGKTRPRILVNDVNNIISVY